MRLALAALAAYALWLATFGDEWVTVALITLPPAITIAAPLVALYMGGAALTAITNFLNRH